MWLHKEGVDDQLVSFLLGLKGNSLCVQLASLVDPGLLPVHSNSFDVIAAAHPGHPKCPAWGVGHLGLVPCA